MKLARKQQGSIQLVFRKREIQLLEIILCAGRNTDPVIRNTTDEEVDALHRKISSVLEQVTGDTVEFSLALDELIKASLIIEAVNTMDANSNYPELRGRFPSDNELEEFTRNIGEVYDQIFPLKYMFPGWTT